jgi:hypothetical protein
MADFVILPAIAFGLILGVIELVFLSQDERGLHWLQHGLHAIPTMIIFTFIAFNISWALAFFKIHENMTIDIIARVVVGLIAMVKVRAAAAVVKGTGRGESMMHVFIIGALMMAGPFIWELALAAPIQKAFPWIK